jgi:dihydrofolate reductase
MTMGKVIAEMSMSLDGYVADLHDGVDALHAWYVDGDIETPTGMDGFSFRTSSASAAILREAIDQTGAAITGRRNFDIAGAWGGRHPLDVPVFVVTHTVPDGWPRADAPFTFVDSVKRAVSAAREAAGAKAVLIASPNIAQQALELGLLDEVAVSLVPVLLGDGIPFFARNRGTPVTLGDPEVVRGSGVTHLRFEVTAAHPTATLDVRASA